MNKSIDIIASNFIKSLTKEEIDYCTHLDRGEYFGFSALHDLMDANVELINAIDELGLPLAQCPIELRGFSGSEEEINFLNECTNRINEKLKEKLA